MCLQIIALQANLYLRTALKKPDRNPQLVRTVQKIRTFIFMLGIFLLMFVIMVGSSAGMIIRADNPIAECATSSTFWSYNIYLQGFGYPYLALFFLILTFYFTNKCAPTITGKICNIFIALYLVFNVIWLIIGIIIVSGTGKPCFVTPFSPIFVLFYEAILILVVAGVTYWINKLPENSIDAVDEPLVSA